MAETTPPFLLYEDVDPMATQIIYLSSDESQYSTPTSTPAYYPESI